MPIIRPCWGNPSENVYHFYRPAFQSAIFFDASSTKRRFLSPFFRSWHHVLKFGLYFFCQKTLSLSKSTGHPPPYSEDENPKIKPKFQKSSDRQGITILAVLKALEAPKTACKILIPCFPIIEKRVR